ncbi:MAG: thioredoxin family protein [Cyclobacteriaceae bacterium]
MKRTQNNWKVMLLTLTLALSTIGVFAQSQINFRDLSWEEAMKVAEKEKKFIFVDAYMKGRPSADAVIKGVFSVDSIAGLYNDNFVSIRIDMQSEAGNAFAPKLQMLMYPAYVFFSADGEQLASSNAYTFEKDPSKSHEFASLAIKSGISRLENTRFIIFEEEFVWDDVLAKSKKEGKPIFIDAYTTWCRPCIQMDRNVFTLDKVADYYNENFINVKMNAEKGEGVEVNKKFEIRGYPTYLFLDSNGELISRFSGYTEAEPFIDYAKEALTKFEESKGIQFEDLDWAGVKAKAKEENKLIFFDAYTTWCGPCKQMAKNVFTDSTLAAFFNDTFINAKFDMEKGEGIDLKDQFGVRAYPTYVYLDSDENVVHQTVGSTTIEEFMQHAKDALSPDKNLGFLEAQYESGNRDYETVKSYLLALKNAYKSDEMSTVASDYLNNQKAKKLKEEENWTLIKEYLKDYKSPSFQYLVKNRAKFYKEFDKKEVDDKIYNVYVAASWGFVTYNEDKTRDFDAEGFDAYMAEIKNSGFDRTEKLMTYAQINAYYGQQMWTEYAQEIDKALKAEIIDVTPLTLYNYCLTMKRYGESPEVLKMAAGWAVMGAEAEPNEKYKVTYYNLQADLLEKAGDEAGAEEARAVGTAISEEETKPKNAMIELTPQK